ncbi:PIR Superfamily Protein [Plasmodium ovale curtisi]|uniref:PIR Superfamily Protein n=1 Tax=Plasmodium ovale curtisi TaxID=864141 RepID=A0A1A8XE31_PLAOA|nr:PIR Superfamily Protein [Plasmodium ovale curtisi]SBT02120.1 PIR Superfamily Protein [Plasmodium ovale curtisi]
MDGQYDTVDNFYMNNIITNMSIAESAPRSPIHDIKSKCESILTNNNSNNIFNILCLTLLTYFKLSTNPESSKYPDNYCGYANYWLNNKVRKNNGELEEYAANFFEVFSSSAFIDFTFNTLMEQLKSLSICAAEQEIILSIDRTMTESSSPNQSEEPTQESTISASTFGTTMGVPFVLLLLYKFTPFSSWLSPQIGNIKNKFNISDNEQNDSLFNYSELNYPNEQYNAPYNIIGN